MSARHSFASWLRRAADRIDGRRHPQTRSPRGKPSLSRYRRKTEAPRRLDRLVVAAGLNYGLIDQRLGFPIGGAARAVRYLDWEQGRTNPLCGIDLLMRARLNAICTHLGTSLDAVLSHPHPGRDAAPLYKESRS